MKSVFPIFPQRVSTFWVFTFCVCLQCGTLFESTANADNWPQWRGVNGNGVSDEKKIPSSWSRQSNVQWRIPLPGPGGATPVVWDDRVFVTSVDGNDLLLMAVSTAGKKLWSQKIGEGNRDVRGDEGNSASPSPCTDGKHVWATMANGDVACFTVDGKKVWELSLPDRYGRFRIAFGMTATPVLDKGRLYFQLIHGEGKSETQEALVACLDAKTGKEIWKQDRVTGATSENEHSYASPMIYRDERMEYLVTHGGDYVIAHRLQDGGEIWRCCLNPKGDRYHPTLRFVSSPLAVAGMIVVPSAKNGPVFSLKPNARGDVSRQESAFLWRHERGTPDVPSPLYHEGLVYLNRENGNLVCVDARSGEKYYENRTTRDRHRASPVYADGKIFLTARKGIVTVVKAGKEFEIISQNDLGEPMSASPAISNGSIYLRTFEALYSIR
ncbi:MAG: PQQ-binding-like beta-propeller repeat protein [Planctomycetota bacterium]|nr:PQQ-binding-like beta-propeller repeat protein [Planctomycetota bacterium]